MEFKKCTRCGCFFTSNNNVCCNCQENDHADMAKLKLYFEENTADSISVEEISLNTGITPKNLVRYMEAEDFSPFMENLNSDIFHVHLD